MTRKHLLFGAWILCGGLQAAQEQVTFFSAYGYRDASEGAGGGDWVIPVQLRVWDFGWKEKQIQAELADFIAKAAGKLGKTVDAEERERLAQRVAGFVADGESQESVRVGFDQIPSHSYEITKDEAPALTDLNGRLEGTIRIPASDLPAAPADGWLSFRALGDHQGKGRVRLLENNGVSIISDIDDTVKITEVRKGAQVVLANTFLRPFRPAPDMQPLYATWTDAAFHYVSAGPTQLSTPLSAFLRAERFPEGSLHMRYFRFHLLDRATWDSLGEQILDPAATFDHKIREISAIMRHFPGRKFILVGDSGEKDPEIYREIRNRFGEQVLKIIIRDVASEPQRLEGMEALPVK